MVIILYWQFQQTRNWWYFSYFSQKISLEFYAICIIRISKPFFLDKIRKEMFQISSAEMLSAEYKYMKTDLCLLLICPNTWGKYAISIRKHTYSNRLKISPPRTENFQIKTSDIFHISAQNIDCGYSLEPPRQGGPNEYPQSMFFSRNMKNNVYPFKP